jgi:hypothetical protein
LGSAAHVMSLALQESPRGLELPSLDFAYLGTRAIVGITMLIHMFFAQLFIGFIVASPLLQWWGTRQEDERMKRLSKALDRFNVLTFSVGATFAGMFLVLIVGLYPRVTATLFTHFFWFFPTLAMAAMGATLFFLYRYHYRAQRSSILAGLAAAFFILLWQAILIGMDTFMVTGGGPGADVQSSGNLTVSQTKPRWSRRRLSLTKASRRTEAGELVYSWEAESHTATAAHRGECGCRMGP